MWGLTLILLLLPLPAQASCTDRDDPAYHLAISRGDYDQAFQIVAQELGLLANERSHFKIIQGFSEGHEDRHGQADPETLELRLDPGLFLEGKEGACQGVAHERMHLEQFHRDRQRLHQFYATHPVPERGWKDCQRDQLGHPDSQQAEEDAYACLEDNDLVPHNASEDIEAVLAQIPYASQKSLRDEDVSYLSENLKNWADNSMMVHDQWNESYYLPEIKKHDVRIFCAGTEYARTMHVNPAPFQQTWAFYCRRIN